MSSLALSVVTLTLGMFFILVGQFKITPKFFPEIHEDMVRTNFHQFKISFFFYSIRNVNLDGLIKYFHFIKLLVGVHMLNIIEWLLVLLKLFVGLP
jgi:hypothetical protein